MSATGKKIFYGWFIVVASALMSSAGAGVRSRWV
jgi:hypothetical protein